MAGIVVLSPFVISNNIKFIINIYIHVKGICALQFVRHALSLLDAISSSPLRLQHSLLWSVLSLSSLFDRNFFIHSFFNSSSLLVFLAFVSSLVFVSTEISVTVKNMTNYVLNVIKMLS